MEIFFKVLAVILLGVAAVLFWQNNSDAAFVAGVLSACAFFLSMRFQLKMRQKQREAEAQPAQAAETAETDEDSTG